MEPFTFFVTMICYTGIISFLAIIAVRLDTIIQILKRKL